MTETPTLFPLIKDLSGQRFGRLLVDRPAHRSRCRRAIWSCICDCGGTIDVPSDQLIQGKTQSCGCLATEAARDVAARHGQWGLPEFECWRGIKARCEREAHPGFRTHGALGIQCRYASLDELIDDVGPRESQDQRLVRLDPTGHFEPGNCAWMTRAEEKLFRRRAS